MGKKPSILDNLIEIVVGLLMFGFLWKPVHDWLYPIVGAVLSAVVPG